MKIIKLVLVGVILFISSTIEAQVSVNVNIGTPPVWGPVGYSNVEYYYLPDVEAYYDVRATQFIYFGGGKWIRSRNLPRQYRNYDLYGGYKVVLNDYHGPRPYTYFKNHKVKYYKGYKGAPQRSIKAKNYNNDNDRHDDRKNYGNYDQKGGKENKGHGKGKD